MAEQQHVDSGVTDSHRFELEVHFRSFWSTPGLPVGPMRDQILGSVTELKRSLYHRHGSSPVPVVQDLCKRFYAASERFTFTLA